MKPSKPSAKTRALVIFVSLLWPVVAFAGNGPQRNGTEPALVNDAIELLHRHYLRSLDDNELREHALKGMISSLDPHSTYIDERELEKMQADLSDRFGGVGMEVISNPGSLPKVIRAHVGTPAARAGIVAGDLIVSIDGHSMQSSNHTVLAAALRGSPGTTVRLTIRRGTNSRFVVTMVREIIKLHDVNSAMLPDGALYVRIKRFGAAAPAEFKNAIEQAGGLGGGRINALVVDLRGNPGGLLNSALGVAGSLLDGGPVAAMRGRDKEDDQAFDAPAKGDLLPGIPIVVLVNGFSASAAELVAGALQDRHRATILGTRTFGKGSVQALIPLKGHGALRITTALYYTPSGRSIQAEGIMPDVVMTVPKEQQAEGASLRHESDLHGAITNPDDATILHTANQPNAVRDGDGLPIKPELMGTSGDVQLKAALSYLHKIEASPRDLTDSAKGG
jgi:carboxyl-terminal processing protease